MISKKWDEEVIGYENRKDEDIIKDIHNGDTLAQDYILDKYKPLVKKKARAFFLIGADREDIIQEGMIGLYKAIRDYQYDRNASFHVFADICISRQIITAIKTATRLKHMPLNSYISLNKPINESESDDTYINFIKSEYELNPETLFIGQESKNFIESHIEEILSGFESKVLYEYLQGNSYSQVAKIMNKSEKSIDNALQRVKKKIEKFLQEKNLDS